MFVFFMIIPARESTLFAQKYVFVESMKFLAGTN